GRGANNRWDSNLAASGSRPGAEMSGGRKQHADDRFAAAARADASRRGPPLTRAHFAAQWTFAAAAAVLIALTVAPAYLRWRTGPAGTHTPVLSRIGTPDLRLSPAPL